MTSKTHRQPNLYLVPDAVGRADAAELTSFTEAARTALRFLTLPAVDRARVLTDLSHLEAQAASGDVRPRLAASLRHEIETTIEGFVRAGGPVAG